MVDFNSLYSWSEILVIQFKFKGSLYGQSKNHENNENMENGKIKNEKLKNVAEKKKHNK